MKIQKLSTNINFSGYKNIISGSASKEGYKLMYMGMTLFDDAENKDLSKFRAVRDAIMLDGGNDDIMTLVYANYGDGNEQMFFDLKQIQVPSNSDFLFMKKFMPDIVFKYYEKSNLDLYSFLANITGRISKESNQPAVSNNIVEVIAKFKKVLMKHTGENRELVAHFLNHSLYSDISHKSIAKDFNKLIHNQMIKYLN